jgi:hypothetical protein
MPYSAPGAAGAGILSVVAAVLALYAAAFVFPHYVRVNILRYLGLAIVPGWHTVFVYAAGTIACLGIAILAALAHAGLHQALDIETDLFAWGVLFGLGQWGVLGAALGFLGPRHPGLHSQQVSDPGFFGINLSLPSAVAFLGMQLLFGAFVAAFYDPLR